MSSFFLVHAYAPMNALLKKSGLTTETVTTKIGKQTTRAVSLTNWLGLPLRATQELVQIPIPIDKYANILQVQNQVQYNTDHMDSKFIDLDHKSKFLQGINANDLIITLGSKAGGGFSALNNLLLTIRSQFDLNILEWTLLINGLTYMDTRLKSWGDTQTYRSNELQRILTFTLAQNDKYKSAQQATKECGAGDVLSNSNKTFATG